MTSDVGHPESEGQPTDLWRLPAIRSLEIRHARYPKPIRRYITAHDVAEYPEAIEFLLTTDGELPIRAIPAVLFVGDVIVSDYEQLDNENYLFRAFEPERLPAGAPISLGWPRRPDKTQETGFRYEPPPK